MDVNFLKEVLPDDRITMQRFDGDTEFLVQGLIADSDRPSFRLKATFKKNQ